MALSRLEDAGCSHSSIGALLILIMAAPADDECIIRLVSNYQVGSKVRYCLKKDGTQSLEQQIMKDGCPTLVLTDTKLDLQDFWSRWNPIIEKIIADAKNGVANMTTVVFHTGGSQERWFVRNHLGESAQITTRGPIRRNITVTGHNQPTLPDYYVDLWELMFPAEIGTPPYVAPSPARGGSCSSS
jgi:hypothetical protein